MGAAAEASFSDTPICISLFLTNTLALIGAVMLGRPGYRCQSGLNASVIQLFRNTGTASSYVEGMNEARQASLRHNACDFFTWRDGGTVLGVFVLT